MKKAQAEVFAERLRSFLFSRTRSVGGVNAEAIVDVQDQISRLALDEDYENEA
jgi:hypothetical protein